MQCTFYCQRVNKICVPLFVLVGPQLLGLELPQKAQLSNGVGC